MRSMLMGGAWVVVALAVLFAAGWAIEAYRTRPRIRRVGPVAFLLSGRVGWVRFGHGQGWGVAWVPASTPVLSTERLPNVKTWKALGLRARTLLPVAPNHTRDLRVGTVVSERPDYEGWVRSVITDVGIRTFRPVDLGSGGSPENTKVGSQVLIHGATGLVYPVVNPLYSPVIRKDVEVKSFVRAAAELEKAEIRRG